MIEECARREHPYECCGLLIGTDDEIVEVVATPNVASDRTRRYEVSPVDHFAQIKRCRQEASIGPTSMRVVGVYHSHPHSTPEPSATDLEQAFEAFLYLIAGPVEGSAPFDVGGYRLKDGRFEAVRLIPVASAGAT